MLRRPIIFLAMLALAVGLPAASVHASNAKVLEKAVVEPAQPWPQAQGGADHPGADGGGPQPPYEIAWTYEPGKVGGASAPVVAGDTVYAVTPEAVLAVALDDGSERWTIERAEGPIVAPAAVAHGGDTWLLYTEGSGEDTALVAFDVQAEERVWEVAVNEQVSSPVTVAEDRAYVATVDGSVLAIDIASGEEAWSHEDDAVRIGVSVAVAQDHVYYAGQDRQEQTVRVVALDDSTGEQAWRKTYLASLATMPTVRDGQVLFGVADGLAPAVVALDAADGDVQWSTPLRKSVSPVSAVATTDDRAYVVDQLVGVYGLDRKSGERLWDFQENGSVMVMGAPVATGGGVLVGLQDGSAIFVDPDTGHLVWRADLADAGLRAPAITAERIVFAHGGAEGGLVAIEHVDGPLLDEVSPTVAVPSKIVMSFAVAVIVVAGLAWVLGLVLNRWLWARGAPADDDDDLEVPDDDAEEDA